MKVILTQDVKSHGKKGDVIEVSQGFARNLFVKKQAIEATPKNLNDLKLHDKNEKKIAQENYEQAQALAKSLEDKSVTVKIKAGEGGRTFGSVSTKEIAHAAKEQLGLDLDKKKMQLEDSIKTLGVTEVPIKLHPKVMATLKVKVVES
ncbi:MAG: 50S ribosomal protein L9 [Lachnospiraceae bacterium]|nr:50S ribosomal protein L9 [Lachnospiraceae bacterium]